MSRQNIFSSLLVFLLLVLVNAGCKRKAKIHLHGKVVNGNTNVPIAGIPVELQKEKRVMWPVTWTSENIGTVVTDVNGNYDFVVEELENDKDYYQLQKVISLDTTNISWKYPLPEIDVYADEPIPDLTMRVFPRGE